MIRWQLSSAATSDLADIWRYTALHWSAAQADHYVGSVRTAITKASEGSPLARPADDIRKGYWRIKTGQHICYFRHISNGKIEVIRILHERMDAPGKL